MKPAKPTYDEIIELLEAMLMRDAVRAMEYKLSHGFYDQVVEKAIDAVRNHKESK